MFRMGKVERKRPSYRTLPFKNTLTLKTIKHISMDPFGHFNCLSFFNYIFSLVFQIWSLSWCDRDDKRIMQFLPDACPRRMSQRQAGHLKADQGIHLNTATAAEHKRCFRGGGRQKSVQIYDCICGGKWDRRVVLGWNIHASTRTQQLRDDLKRFNVSVNLGDYWSPSL